MPNFAPKRHHIFFALVIMALAFVLRTQVIWERAISDPRFIPPPLSDSDTYYQLARGLLLDTFPQRPYDYQPGAIYVYAGLMAIIGDSIALLRLALAVLDSVAIGFLIGAGWLLTNRSWGGLAAGLLMAVYPVSIFYGGVILVEPLALDLLCVWFYFMLWQRRQLALWRTVLLGLLTGLIFVTRSQVAPIGILWLIYFAFGRPGWRAGSRHALAFIIGTVILITPFTLWNLQFGSSQLSAGGGWWQLYSGTNRDGDGTGGRSVAFDAEDYDDGGNEDHWRDALFRDIELNPGRFVGLMLRKTALFWSEAEPGNNEDFFGTRYVTNFLKQIPLISFRHLTLFGILGLAALWYDDERLAAFFGATILLFMVGVIISFALSRFRYPAVAPMFLLTSYALVRGWDALYNGVVRRSDKNWDWLEVAQRAAPPLIRRWTIPVVLTAFLVWFPMYALTGSPPPFPPKRIMSDVPTEARLVHVTFGDVLTLRGWRAAPDYPDWDAAQKGWQRPDYPYVVELFWTLEQDADEQYQFFIAYIDAGERFGALDRAIGTVSHPPKTTETWQVGEIYSELVAFRIAQNAPRTRSGQIIVGAYRIKEDGTLEGLPITSPAGLDGLTLHTLAVYDPAAIPPAPENLAGQDVLFGVDDSDKLALRGYEMPDHAQTGENINITFYWDSLGEIASDYNIFIHVVDDTDTLITQGDSAVTPGLFTSNWLPNYPNMSTLPVPMPAAPGSYRVYIGLVDAYTGARLTTVSPDNRVLIGEIEVEE
jgi:4-amino-4-deoxy-L-arabinose transferase-like glycosyltransferase